MIDSRLFSFQLRHTAPAQFVCNVSRHEEGIHRPHYSLQKVTLTLCCPNSGSTEGSIRTERTSLTLCRRKPTKPSTTKASICDNPSGERNAKQPGNGTRLTQRLCGLRLSRRARKADLFSTISGNPNSLLTSLGQARSTPLRRLLSGTELTDPHSPFDIY